MGDRTCSIDGCNKKAEKRGWCGMHYRRWRVHGDPSFVTPRGRAICSVEDCDRFCFGHGLCSKHYTRLLRYGTTQYRKPTLQERLFARCFIRETGCVEWAGAQSSNGYGHIRENGREISVHRLAFEIFNGPIPEGLTVDHLCENKVCVAAAHLEAVLIGVNVRRASKGQAAKTHCKRGHLLSMENIYFVAPSDGNPGGQRICLQCRRIHQDAYSERKRKAAA